MSGFKSPLPILGLSSSPVTVQGGFRTPLPGWNAGGTGTTVVQAGYRGMLGFWSGGASSAPSQSDIIDQGHGVYRGIPVDDDQELEELLMIMTTFLRVIQ